MPRKECLKSDVSRYLHANVCTLLEVFNLDISYTGKRLFSSPRRLPGPLGPGSPYQMRIKNYFLGVQKDGRQSFSLSSTEC
jgi:hypothetical protein